MKKYYQRILFGSPGTGKSHRVYNHYLSKLNIDEESPDAVSTVFHPEYGYGDFMGKLVPYTEQGEVTYNYYPGDFLKALSRAYYNMLRADNDEDIKSVALIIDEINRGNSSEIFGKVFQLLDREPKGGESYGWSDYNLSINKIQRETLLSNIGIEFGYDSEGKIEKYKAEWTSYSGYMKWDTFLDKMEENGVSIRNDKIKIPPNLSIFGTMNTSNESVYFMDSAFKRRWNWEFVGVGNSDIPNPSYISQQTDCLTEKEWYDFADNLNYFMKQHYDSIRGIEDKQIGYYFIIERPVGSEKIRSKVMFFIWDTVFDRDKEPLVDLMNKERDEIITFGDFVANHNEFVNSILEINRG